MTDVIRTSKESDGWDVVGEYADTVAAMVATENELRAEIAELREQLRTAIPAIATLKQTRDELEAEIERLRAFLTEIATLPGQHHAGMITACDIAKHALGDNPTPHETLHVGASDWEEFGIAVRTVSQNCDMTDIARRGDWLQRELRARGFDIVRSGREDTPDEFRSAHVINVPWCQCCEARVPADHVCACEVIAEPSKEWWKCEYSGPGGQCGRDNHYARATCWYCHHPRVNAQKASEHLYVPVSSGNDRCSVCGQPKGQCSALSEGDQR